MVRTEQNAAVTVTVVDDEPVAQDVLVRAARSWHYGCQSASTAEQALELLEKNLTPIVVTDLRMPGRGGVWLVREIRRRWPQVGVIVLTAGCDQDAADECRLAGAHHYFFKPIKLDEFRHVLDTAARTYRLEQENQAYRTGLERAVRRQTNRVRRTFLSAIDSLVRTMEERDPYTAGHSLRVRCYALRLGDAVGLPARQRKYLSLAAKLHDIGKVGVPEAVLNKPAALTDDEFRHGPRTSRHRRAHPFAHHPQPRSAGRHPRPSRTPRRRRLSRRPGGRPGSAAGPPHRHPGLLRRPDHLARLPPSIARAASN